MGSNYVINFMIMNKWIEIVAKPNMYIYFISDIILNVCLKAWNFILYNMFYLAAFNLLKSLCDLI